MPNVDNQGPVIDQGPLTQSAPLNVGIGTAVVGASQAGMMAATGNTDVLGVSIFLNLVSQVTKKFKWFPEHEGLIVLMLVASFIIGYFLLYHGDTAHSFLTSANSTMQALLNYKGDKAAGLNVMPPTPPHLEYLQPSIAGAGS